MHAHASTNATYGSFRDISLNRLLELCREQFLTGKIDVVTSHGRGELVLRAGVIEHARLADHTGDIALAQLRKAEDGAYIVAQRLPDPEGDLGPSAEARGDLESLSLRAVMSYCEDNALTCTITIVNHFDRAELAYTAGAITRVVYNGLPDDGRIAEIMRFEDARFRVSTPPIDQRLGRPVLRRAPTEPFTIAHLQNRPAGKRERVHGASPVPFLDSNRRGRDRIALNVPVLLEFCGDVSWVETDAALVDLSPDGMLVGCDRVPCPEQRVYLIIEHVLLGTCIAVGAAIRTTKDGFGVRFAKANDMMGQMLASLGDSKLSCRAGLLGTTTDVRIRIESAPDERTIM